MSIVRELVTKLSFSFDRKNLDKLEKSILGFKKTFAVTASDVAGFVKKITDFPSAIADAALATRDLAQFSRLAFTDFKALQLAAGKFAIPEQNFSTFLEGISTGILEATRGVGNLFDIIQKTEGRINFKDAEGNLLDVKDVLFQISNFIKLLPTQSQRLRFLTEFQGIDLSNAGRFLELLQLSNVELQKVIENEHAAAKAQEALLPNLDEYRKKLSEASQQWSTFTQQILTLSLPLINESLRGLNVILKDLNSTPQNTNFKPESGNLISSLLKNETGFAAMERANAFNSGSPTVTNNSTFQINVLPGTTEQQGTAMAEQVQQVIDNFWDEKLREVFSNNPQVE